ncbi:hypothetical protein V1505DRAFT_318104, partial [Lipomyces doorenjongii]
LAVLIRNLVRTIKYAQGQDGFISNHEAMFYIFDAFLMFLVFLIFVVVHPGRLLGAHVTLARPTLFFVPRSKLIIMITSCLLLSVAIFIYNRLLFGVAALGNGSRPHIKLQIL